MSPGGGAGTTPGSDAALALAFFAIDPAGLGGVALRARTGPVRDAWLNLLRVLLPQNAPVRRLPLHAGDGRLIGGLDLAATLRAGRPIAERGLLADTDGGVLLLAMAERIPAATVARLAAVLDTGEVVLERDGVAGRMAAHLGMVALDEGLDDEKPHPALLERLAFHLDLDGLDEVIPVADRQAIEAATRQVARVICDDAILAVLAETSAALGVASLRAELFGLRVARLAAALAGRDHVSEADAAVAARLVLAPRATRFPTPPATEDTPPPPVPPAETPQSREAKPAADAEGRSDAPQEQSGGEMVLAAAKAAIPPGLLMQLQAAAQGRAPRAAAGKAGVLQRSTRRGRPAGVGRGEPRGARLNVIETLRAAAPWQKLRARMGQDHAAASQRIEVRTEDFRITRFKQRSETTTLFVVDASGSLALNRLAEAKGAVELLLQDCYVRRDQVALMAFRGKSAELLLPPTRSLVRAKRSLAGLPGGGATPLAVAIDRAIELADQLRRRGQTPVIVFLTDGRANVARDGSTGRVRADEDAMAAARAARLTGIRTLVVDAAQRPQPPARRLALEMGALYLPLPHANAAALSEAVKASAA